MRHAFHRPILLRGSLVALVLLGVATAPSTLWAYQFIKQGVDADQDTPATIPGTAPAPEAGDTAEGVAETSAAERAVTTRPKPASNGQYSEPDPALELLDPRTYRVKIAIRIDAPEAAATGVVATGPIPMEWPEQRVRLLNQKRSPNCRVSEQVFKGQAAILKLQVARIPKGGSAFVERMYEITRYRTRFVLPGDDLEPARGAPPEMRTQLAGIPPGIQLNNPRMIELAESLRRDHEEAGAWETVKAFWSWTRDNVKFENGDFRGALSAIDDRCGDCEEMSALFVGMCRLSGIPARTVWVESHDYPEFYLLDKEGKGHWIPAQVLGPAWFGEMAEYRPIFQKGDRFYDPLKREYVRYVPQTVRGADARVAPRVQFVHEIIADSDINGPTYNSASSRDRQ